MGKRRTNRVTHIHRLFLVMSSIFLSSPLVAVEPATVIKGGDLYTITSGIIRNGTILIEDGRISHIGQNVEAPKNAKIIDARGKVVMPGLVAASGEVGVTGFGSINKISDSLDPFSNSVSLALASGVTTAFLSRGRPSSNNPIGGTNAVIKTTYGDLDNMLVKEPVAENVTFSSGQWLRKTNFLQNLRKAQNYLQKLDAYARSKDKNRKLQEPKKPAAVDAYIRLLKRQLPARIQAMTAADILGALELVDEFGIKIIIEGAVEGWVVAEEIARRDVWVIITPRQKWRPNEDISGPSGSTLENAAILKKAGVKLAIIPTSPNFATWGIAGRDLITLPMEAAFAISGGLDEQTALEAITIAAAEIVGVSERVGSLQVGKDADIIILDGHPFHHKTFVEVTLINGEVLYEKAKSPYFAHITHDD